MPIQRKFLVMLALFFVACDLGILSPYSPGPNDFSKEFHVSGVVRDAADDSPIEGATIELRDSYSNGILSMGGYRVEGELTSDENGRFDAGPVDIDTEFWVSTDDEFVVDEKPYRKYATSIYRISRGSETTLDITVDLKPYGVLNVFFETDTPLVESDRLSFHAGTSGSTFTAERNHVPDFRAYHVLASQTQEVTWSLFRDGVTTTNSISIFVPRFQSVDLVVIY